MSAAVTMSKKPLQFCTYSSVKLDSEVLPLVKIAAAKKRKTVQEYLSDLANLHASEDAGEDPIDRKPPPPRAKP